MAAYTILTDSCCDLPATMAEEMELCVLPLSFVMEGREYFNYLDHRDIAPADFYRRLRDGALGTTSAINVAFFTETMSALVAEGKDVLCISFSSGLSSLPGTGERAVSFGAPVSDSASSGVSPGRS